MPQTMRTSSSNTTLLAYEREVLPIAPRALTVKRLPLIPVSPLFQLSREYNKVVAQTKDSLLNATTTTILDGEGEGEDEQSKMVVLETRLAKATEKLDHLSNSIPSIQTSLLSDFNAYDVAKEIAYIDSNLFRTVSLNHTSSDNTEYCARVNVTAEDEVKKWNDHSNGFQPLLDFHRYLTNSFAHQIIIEADFVSLSKTSNTTKKRKHCIIAQLIYIAHILLYVYRDFLGCTAILTCLQMPEIQRLHSLWLSCPNKLTRSFRDMVKLLSPENNYEVYYEQLKLHTLCFMIPDDDSNTAKSQMIAVPFIQAHLSVIRKLIQEHALVSSARTTVSQANQPKSNNTVLLSVAGQALVLSAMKILQFCQHQNIVEPAEFDKFIPINHVQSAIADNKRRLSLHRSRDSSCSNLKLSVQLCSDLNLLKSNANIYHWLVSRAYLTKQQLNMESVHVQPLDAAEMLPLPHLCEEEEEEAYLWHWELLITSMKQRQITAITTLCDQQQKQREREVEELEINAPLSTIKTSSEKGLQSVTAYQTKDDHGTTAERSNSNRSTPFLNVSNNSRQQQLLVDNVENSATSRTEAHKSVNLITFPASTRQLEETTCNADEAEEGKDSKDTLPILAEIGDNWTGYSTDNNMIVQNKSQASDLLTVVDGEDEEDEEWTGYPVDATAQEEDDEDEIWRGYPIDSDDEEEEPMNAIVANTGSTEGGSLESSRNSSDTSSPGDNSTGNKFIDKPTTPTTSSNRHFQEFPEWKGYQQMILREQGGLCIESSEGQAAFSNIQVWTHTPAIGKAAARRIQQAIHHADSTDRRRLPSSFMVSSSAAAT